MLLSLSDCVCLTSVWLYEELSEVKKRIEKRDEYMKTVAAAEFTHLSAQPGK